jgi:hypothetical protein
MHVPLSMKTAWATSSARIGRDAGMVTVLDNKTVQHMDLCKLVVNELKKGKVPC